MQRARAFPEGSIAKLATMIQAAPRPETRLEKRRPAQTPRDVLALLFLASWICVLISGALRKWAFPSLNILYLLQDLPLFMAYVYAFWKGLFWGGRLAWTCIVLTAVLAVESMLQIIFGNLQLRTAVVGLHHYVFYLPILFLAPVCWNSRHRRDFIRFNLLVIVPMALIAAMQSRSPKAAWINRTSAGDDGGFALVGDTVRATGTFNFTQSYSIWCGIAVGLVLGEWLLPPGRRAFKSRLLLLVCTLSAVLATMVSGSRTAVTEAALGFMGAFTAVLITRNVKHILRFSAVLVLVPVIAVISYFAAPVSFSAVVDRFSGENNQEDIFARVDHAFFGFTFVPQYSVLGVGIGWGIPAANPGAGMGIVLSEHEPIRTVEELGSYIGTALVVMRYVGGVMLVFASFRALQLTRGHSFPHGVPLAFAAAPLLMIGELERSAPVLATQIFFTIALILGAILYRQEPLDFGPEKISKTR